MTFLSYSNKLIRNAMVSADFRKCFPKFNSNFQMLLFIDEIKAKKREQFIKIFSIYKPLVANFPRAVFLFSRVLKASVSVVEVVNQWFKSIHHEKTQCVCFATGPLNVEATFFVNDSGKIGQLSVSPFHKSSLFIADSNTLATKYKEDGERLSEKTPKGEAIVCSPWRHGEGDPKRFPRQPISKADRLVTKVTALTQPVRSAFWGFLNSAIITDLQNCDGFISVANYPVRDGLDAEWGSVGNVRWLRSSQGSVQTNVTPNIYNNIIVGREAYCCMHLSGRDAVQESGNNIAQNGSIIVKPLGSAGALDPANQFGTVSFSVFYAARILNDAFLTNLRSTAA